ncbi:hypothetical protein [Puia dinghuensis]|uniref:Uncharacterized protein n=1 Tax=Puia dinghuensis TaxID=1792502 RepID=A0A8J2XQY0_9BACT|nr:hypothetical protein [Puia dinghuensis]GGA86612.1 hypothetical protein GCM10011511_07110 [Puia dinghuensis]
MHSKLQTYLPLAVLFLHSFMSCSGQQGNSKKEEMDSLINRELRNQDNAKTGNKHPMIQVITDPKEVARLRQEIEEKIHIQKIAELEAKKKKSLAEAYKSGDKTVVPAIVEILKGNDKRKKGQLLAGLCKKYDDPEDYSIKEQRIIDLILKAVDDPVFEKEAVQLAGINALPGYEEKFEARLLSGKSTDAGRIFFWLGKQAKSHKALDYVAMRVRENSVTPEELDGLIAGLEGFGEKGSPEVRKAVADIALAIYRKKLISDERIEDLKNSAMTSDAAEGLLACLFDYGDQQVIPIAKDILNRHIRVVGPVKALIRLEGPRDIEMVYQYLKSENDFYTGLDLVESIDRKYVDDKMLKAVLVEFAKRNDTADHAIQRMVRSFVDLKADDLLKNSSAIISNADVASRLKKYYELSHFSSDQVIADLVRKELIGKAPDPTSLRKAREDASNDPEQFILAILESQNLYVNFDAETDFVPVDYDKLLQRFAEKCEGKLKDMTVWMDDGSDKGGENFNYVITVVYKGQAFIAKPQDVGDWYDIMTVNALLDHLMERSGSPKRFNSIETGDQTVQYVFGVPAAVQEIFKKYKI